MDLSRGGKPAYIAYIGRACSEGLALIERAEKIIHRMSGLFLEPDHFFTQISVILGTESGDMVIPIVSLRQSVGKIKFLRSVFRNTDLFKIAVQNTF